MNRDDPPRKRAADNDDPPASPDGMFGPDGLAQRIQAAVFGAVGCLPRALRTWAATICHAANLQRLIAAMTRWIQGGPFDKEQFGRRFLGRDAEDPLVVLLYDAAPRVGRATGHAELGHAATKIAAAILLVGPDRWARFLAELEDRALDPTGGETAGCHPHHPVPPCPESPEPESPNGEPAVDVPVTEQQVENDPAPATPTHSSRPA